MERRKDLPMYHDTDEFYFFFSSAQFRNIRLDSSSIEPSTSRWGMYGVKLKVDNIYMCIYTI